jgi:hypothetical protein
VRKLVSVLLLVLFQASSLEAVVGLARDGAVHHETVAQAAAHAELAEPGDAEHGHEAASEAPDAEHGPDHQHGTGADHCTHAHGTALFGPLSPLGFDAVLTPPAPTVMRTPSHCSAARFFHPPRV